MGIDSKNPPLPAPTESSSENRSDLAPTDLATDISRRTDRTSYSIPEDGSPVTLSTKKLDIRRGGTSEASLLIEYFEVAQNASGRPSVRVKISPSNKKRKEARTPLLEQKTYRPKASDLEESPVPLPFLRLQNRLTQHKPGLSDFEYWDSEREGSGSLTGERHQSQYVHLASDISSMPADSMIEGTSVSQVSTKKHAPPQSSHDRTEHEPTYMDTLKAPSRSRSRSVSKERITQKVLEKLAREQSPEPHLSTTTARKHRPTSTSIDRTPENSKLRSKKSSRSYRGDDGASITDSSVVHTRDRDSSLSGLSKSSLNPKLLQTVEDVVRRLILPEIETIKRQQSTRGGSAKFDSQASNNSLGSKITDSDLSQSASASFGKPKVVLNREQNSSAQTLKDHSTRRGKHRRSTRESATSNSRVHDGFSEKVMKDNKDNRSVVKSAATEPDRSALTVAALHSHDSQSSMNNFERERRQRRRQRSQGHIHSSVSHTPQKRDGKTSKDLPYMPMQSEMADSELTRESILSAETAEASSSISGQYDEHLRSINEVSRGSSAEHALTLTQGLARSSRSDKALKATRSDKSLSKDRQAALMAAGFGAGSSALYGHAHRSTRQNAGDRKSDPAKRAIDSPDAVHGSTKGIYKTPHDTERYVTTSPVNATDKGDSLALVGSIGQDNAIVKQPLGKSLSNGLVGSHRPINSLSEQRAITSDPTSDPVPSSELIESQVASLLDPSTIGSLADQSENADREVADHDDDMHNERSAARWATLRDNAQQRSLDGLSAEHLENAYHINSGHEAFQACDESMQPLKGAMTNQRDRERDPSILEDPLGDEEEIRGQWPYEPTPPTRDSESAFSPSGFADDHILDGLATPSGLGIAAAAHNSTASASKGDPLNRSLIPSLEVNSSTLKAQNDQAHSNSNNGAPLTREREPIEEVGGADGVHTRALATDSPLSISRTNPANFEDAQDIHPSYNHQQAGPEVYQDSQSLAYGTKGSLYDSSTGNGLNNIQSRDVVALMDHLTVRDGQRNARDTEILVTLVRSAAEMRNSFEDMKKFVQAQNQANLQRGDIAADRSMNKTLSGHNGSRNSPSSRIARSSSATEESPGKRKNIFQRALRGLGGRNSTDLNRMEDMLVQILDEVEALRAVQTAAQQPVHPTRDLDRRDQPSDGQGADRVADAVFGTISSRFNGADLESSTPQYRQTHDPQNNVQPTYQDATKSRGQIPSEDASDDVRDWRTPSPTSDARETTKHVQESINSYNAQVFAGSDYTFLDAKSGHNRHKSTGSSLFGIPKVSRWSKTTASSMPNTPNYRSQRSSQQTKWGSDIHDDSDNNHGPAEPVDEVQDAQSPEPTHMLYDRATSPLIPESLISLEEAKYQANRHSLTLQHPQPRQGPNLKQRSLMETQARVYGGISPGLGPTSPQSDAFGSFPALARINRFSSGQENRPTTLSPLSSQDDSPVFRSKDAMADPLVPTESRGAPLYSHEQINLEDTYSSDAHSDDFDNGEGQWIEPVPLARKQSPYSPGGLLAPIEERYSLEQTRSSISATPAQERLSNSGSRSETPQQIHHATFGRMESPNSRKITGPREMPHRSRTSSRGEVGISGINGPGL